MTVCVCGLLPWKTIKKKSFKKFHTEILKYSESVDYIYEYVLFPLNFL